jgi:DNA adenine methylase
MEDGAVDHRAFSTTRSLCRSIWRWGICAGLKAPSRTEIYNEIDERIVNVFRVLRDPVKSEELRHLLELTPFASAEYDDCYSIPVNEIDDARRIVFRSFSGIGSDSIFRKNGFRRGFSNCRHDPGFRFKSYLEAIPYFVERLDGVIIENLDWQKVIKIYDTPKTLFFVDPPYLSDVCSSRAVTYSHPMETKEEHIVLGNVLNQVDGNVVLSGYRSDLYEELFSSWTSYAHSAVTGMGKKRTEMIWIKRPEMKLF